MKFYKDHYDVIVIGGALAGLSSALMLADKGLDVLVLERHNLAASPPASSAAASRSRQPSTR